MRPTHVVLAASLAIWPALLDAQRCIAGTTSPSHGLTARSASGPWLPFETPTRFARSFAARRRKCWTECSAQLAPRSSNLSRSDG